MALTNSFHEFRRLALSAYKTSPPELWLTKPIDAAIHCANLVLGGLGPEVPDPAFQGVYRSVLVNALCSGLWEIAGRPVVTLGHKTAAACATSYLRAEDAEAFIRPPWPAFVIRLPSPLFCIMQGDQPLPATLALVIGLPDKLTTPGSTSEVIKWWYKVAADADVPPNYAFGLAGSGLSLWGFNLDTAAMLSESPEDDERWQRWDTYEYGTSDQRVDLLIRRLIVNTCLYVESANSSERIMSIGKKTTVSKRPSKPDAFGSYNEYHINAGIQLNLADGVRQYIATGKSGPKYATMVAPHWKRVAHGAKHSLRRLQYIEAYWKKGV